jgi:hypothetical protein
MDAVWLTLSSFAFSGRPGRNLGSIFFPEDGYGPPLNKRRQIQLVLQLFGNHPQSDRTEVAVTFILYVECDPLIAQGDIESRKRSLRWPDYRDNAGEIRPKSFAAPHRLFQLE